MEEGKGTTTINDYLTYVPVRGVKDAHSSSSTSTTRPRNPRDLHGVELGTWEKFAESVQQERETALARESEVKLVELTEKGLKVYVCGNEGAVETLLGMGVFTPLQRLLSGLGVYGLFRTRPSDVILDPDFSWQSETMKQSASTDEERRLIDKILIEVKTFWAFDAPDDLVEIVNSELSSPSQDNQNSIGKKAVRAVSQIYGYLSINQYLGTYR